MMGSEDDNSQQSHIFTGSVADDMEYLTLDHSLASDTPSSEFRSTMGASSLVDDDPLSAPSHYSGGEFRIEDDDPLVQPPSYEDVVGDSSENGGRRRGDSSGSSSTALGKDSLEVKVSDPQKETDPNGSIVPGGGTYVTYQVQAVSSLPHFSSRKMAVRRRFRDFVTLADRLAETHRGYFIPPRPDKNVVESQVMHSKEFVEIRRVALEKYLKRLAAHPKIRESEELRAFLESEGRLPFTPSAAMASRMFDGAAKLPRQLFGSDSMILPGPQDAAQPAKGGRDLFRMFRDLRQSVSSDWTAAKPVLTEEDKSFMEKKEKLVELEKYLTEASSKAEQLVRAQQDMGESLGELGLSFIKLSKFEETNLISSEPQKRHAKDAKVFGNASVGLSRKWPATNRYTIRHLSQLQEYVGLIQAAHTAFSERQQALVTVQTLTTDLALKKDKAEKLEAASKKVLGGDQARTRRVGELQGEIASAEKAKEAAESEYKRIQERNREELERVETERNRDFMNMLEGFVRTQMDIADKSAMAWSSVAQEFSQEIGQSEGSRQGGLRGGS